MLCNDNKSTDATLLQQRGEIPQSLVPGNQSDILKRSVTAYFKNHVKYSHYDYSAISPWRSRAGAGRRIHGPALASRGEDTCAGFDHTGRI